MLHCNFTHMVLISRQCYGRDLEMHTESPVTVDCKTNSGIHKKPGAKKRGISSEVIDVFWVSRCNYSLSPYFGPDNHPSGQFMERGAEQKKTRL